MSDNTVTPTSTGNGKAEMASHLFLVRVWTDETAEGREGWSGKVQHVLTGKAYPFHDWGSLAGLLLSMLPATEGERAASLEPGPAQGTI